MARFERDPHFPARLADAHEFAGEWARAAELRRRVCELAPDVADNHLNLALALAEQGDLDAGASAARRAVELDPSLAAELPENVAQRLA
jgi:tetratricopeptide (TPR) repeat protein